MPFQAGYDKYTTWEPDSGGGATTMNITGWQAEDGVDTPEITHTGTNGEQAFLAAIKRCPCQITMNYNSGATPASIGLTAGRKGTITFKTGGTDFELHVIIEKVPYQSSVNGVVSLTIQAKSDAIDASGSVVDSITFA